MKMTKQARAAKKNLPGEDDEFGISVGDDAEMAVDMVTGGPREKKGGWKLVKKGVRLF